MLHANRMKEATLNNSTGVTGITRDGLREIKTRMVQGSSTQISPKEILRQHSDMVDSLVRKAFQKAQVNFSSPSVCLMAVGGYGRAELAPYSDIDLLLDFPDALSINHGFLIYGAHDKTHAQ